MHLGERPGAPAEGRLQRGEEVARRGRGERLGARGRQGPDQRPVVPERQQRERAFGGEALVGGGAGRGLGARRARRAPRGRSRGAGTPRPARPRRAPAQPRFARAAATFSLDERRAAPRRSARVLRDVAERGHAAFGGAEARAAEAAALRDVDVGDRRRRETGPRRRRARGSAGCRARARSGGRPPRAPAPGRRRRDRVRGRRAARARARSRPARRRGRGGRRAQRRPSRISASMSATAFGASAVSTSQPPSVTAHVVLDADADVRAGARARRRRRGCSRPGSTVSTMPGASARQCAVALVVARVVHVQAQPVAGAVHVEALVGLLFEHLVEAAREQLQVEHALRQHAHRGVVRRRSRRCPGARAAIAAACAASTIS